MLSYETALGLSRSTSDESSWKNRSGEDSKEMALVVLVSDEMESRESVEVAICWPSPLTFLVRSERRLPRRFDDSFGESMMMVEWSLFRFILLVMMCEEA